MTPEELFREGKLDEAITTLGAGLREDPSNLKKRTFLFELLCFAGQYDRADKQLELLGDQNRDSMLGGLLYRGALSAERTRQEMFDQGKTPSSDGPAGLSGTLNGKPFQSIRDGDGRIGPKLEIIAGGDYMWVGFENIAQIDIEAPKRLRDLLWLPARLRTGTSFKGQDLGEVLIPVIAPGSFSSEDPQVRLGRVTEWYRDEQGVEFPMGRKVFMVDDEEIPILEIRKLEMTSASVASP